MNTTLIDSTTNPMARLILAHGAGADMHHPFMATVAAGLARAQIEVVRFNFPYMLKRAEDGRKRPPDRQPKLLDAFVEMVDTQGEDLPLFIAGKSMGGRMATLLVTEKNLPQIQGVLCLGYPFHAPGKQDQWRAEHFADLPCPTLILQGERDPFGTREEILQHPLLSQVSVDYLADGEHSFKPRKASGHTEAENLQQAVDRMAAFIVDQLA